MVIYLNSRVEETQSGRVLEVLSDQPGVQFYTANFLPNPSENNPIIGKNKVKYWKHGAFCLEAQNYPNAINQVFCNSNSIHIFL